MSRGLSGAAAAAAGIGVSRVFGVIRATLTTNVLGIGVVGDAFTAALRIPNVIQNLLGEGAVSAAFVPTYSRLCERDEHAAGRLAGAFLAFLLAVSTVVAAIGVWAARPITRLLAWGFVGERFELTVRLVRITVLGAALLVLSAWCLGVLNSHRRFFVSYAAPVLWNCAQIAVLVFAVLWQVVGADAAAALAWGAVAGTVVQFAVQLRVVLRTNPEIRFGTDIPVAEMRSVLAGLGPAIAGRGAMQASAFADLALASLLAVGAASALAAAQSLYLLPVSLIGISVAAAELPELGRLTTARQIAERTSARLREVTFIATGCAVLYLTAGRSIVDALFNLGGLRTAIAPDDVTLIALVLGAYALGLPAAVASRLCQNVLYAARNTAAPARFAAVRLVVGVGVGAMLMMPFDRLLAVNGTISGFGDMSLGSLSWTLLADEIRLAPDLPARLGAVGLALGASIGAWVELALLRKRLVSTQAGRDAGAWPAGRLLGGSGGRHLAPALCAGVLGVPTAAAVAGTPALLRTAAVGIVVAGTWLGVGSMLRLPVVSSLWERVSRPTRDATAPPSANDEEDRE